MTTLGKQSESVGTFIWQGSMPVKTTESVVKLPLEIVQTPALKKSAKAHPFFRKGKSPNLISKILEKSQDSSLFYSIKYLGITKGQIGVLSKRSRIPQLSPLETCKDVPLVQINSSISKSASKSTQKIDYSKKMPREESINKDLYKDENEFVIHTYARPRGLISAQRSSYRDGVAENKISIVTQCQRTGPSGWKLIRPKSTNTEKTDRNQKKNDLTSFQLNCKHMDIETGYSEPYLKYLEKQKKKLRFPTTSMRTKKFPLEHDIKIS